MLEWKKIPTSAEVYAVIWAKHCDELRPFASYTYCDGIPYGNPDRGEVMTEWGIENSDVALIGSLQTYDIVRSEKSTGHINRQFEYWICVAQQPDE